MVIYRFILLCKKASPSPEIIWLLCCYVIFRYLFWALFIDFKKMEEVTVVFRIICNAME